MTIFVDASALVAMNALEPGYEELGNRLDGYDVRLTSPIACWEATLALSRLHVVPVKQAGDELRAFLDGRRIEIVAIGDLEGTLALEAHQRFGKPHHPARLNMGDCFAYACTKSAGADLLHKGDDFAHTDLA